MRLDDASGQRVAWQERPLNRAAKRAAQAQLHSLGGSLYYGQINPLNATALVLQMRDTLGMYAS